MLQPLITLGVTNLGLMVCINTSIKGYTNIFDFNACIRNSQISQNSESLHHNLSYLYIIYINSTIGRAIMALYFLLRRYVHGEW